MSTPTNRITRSNGEERSVFPDAINVLSSAVSFNQGDLLILTAGLLAKAVLEADYASFLGIAAVTVVNGKLASPYQGTAVDAAQAITSIPGPKYSVEAKMISKTGDAWVVGGAVYGDPTDGPEFVSSTGTKQIGVYQGPAIASAAQGQTVEVLLGHRYPGDTLQGV